MFRKLLISLIFIGIVIVVGNITIVAQLAPVAGTVEVVKADNTRERVAGALIEVYRTDIKSGAPSNRSDKKGTFMFAGLQLGATFTFAVSAPGCAPRVFPGIKAGQQKLLFTLAEGDGRKLTEDEVRKGGGDGGTTSNTNGTGNAGELTAEQKKAQAEYDEKVKVVTDKNEKVKKTNEIVDQAFKGGKEAFDAKNYDLAIAKFEEGIAADPDFVGTAPIFGNNRSMGLRLRAIASYNAGVKATETAERVAQSAKAKKDLADSAQGYLRAWTVLKNASASDIADPKNYELNKQGTLTGSIDTFRAAVDTGQVDPATLEAAKVLVPEFINSESDAARKMAASMTLADLFRVGEDRESAIASYKKVLESSPDNVDALAYLGIVLVDLGWIKDNDKALSQEGANYLQKFVGLAPDTHKLKSGAVEYLNILKAQSIVPVKAAPTRKKP